MKTQTRERTRRLSVLVTVSAVVSLAAAGWAVAAPGALGVPAVGYRLAAQLTAAQEAPASTGAASAKGRFDGLLVRTGPGQAAKVGPLPAGCKVVNPPYRSGLPARIVCD